jgi:hypothetical protein
MSVSPVPTPAPSEPVQNGDGVQDGGMEGLEQGVGALGLEGGLHQACAEGKLEDVRSILTRSLDGLEIMGMSSSSLNMLRTYS